jgi:adenylate cyclase
MGDSAIGISPPAVLRDRPEQVGFNNIMIDSDGLTRRVLLFMDANNEKGESGVAFPLLLAHNYLIEEEVASEPDPERPELMKLGETTFEMLESNTGSYVGVDVGGYQQLLDVRNAPKAFPSMSLVELLEGEADASIYRDKLVILLTVALSTPDNFHTGSDLNESGTSKITGGEIHAHIASQILRYALGEASPIRTLSEAQEILLILFFSGLGATLGRWTGSSRSLALFVGGVVIGLGLGGAKLLQLDWWIPIVPIGIACIGSGGLVIADMRRRERVQRAELMQLFSRHVAKEVAEDIWAHRDEYLEGGRPRPERVRATILFVDMKDFTARVDKLEPKELMEWLNQYLDKLSRDVLTHRGHIEDYFGDGMMCAFGVPVPSRDEEGIKRDAQRAVDCAITMATSLEELNESWQMLGFPTAGIRIGICSGDIITGSMGSAERLKYSMVGDVVVTAQRLQALDDSSHDFVSEPCRILISDHTLGYVAETVATREFGEHLLKGRSEPVMVYEVVSRGETRNVV